MKNISEIIREKFSAKTDFLQRDFEEVIEELSSNEFIEILRFCFKCYNININENKLNTIADILKRNRVFRIEHEFLENFILDFQKLKNIFRCVVIAEVRLNGAMLYPPELRHKAISQLAQEAGVDVSFLIRVSDILSRSKMNS